MISYAKNEIYMKLNVLNRYVLILFCSPFFSFKETFLGFFGRKMVDMVRL